MFSYCQIWLNLLIDDRKFGHITKIGKQKPPCNFVHIFARKKYVRNVYQNIMSQMHIIFSENFISGAQQKERKREKRYIGSRR
jgi:hypothetical protein